MSGRGVGMDVVRVVADRLGGSVRVESEPGRGTTVLLDLPLSLALLRVVLVEVNDELVAIPTAPIWRILHVVREAIMPSPTGTVIEIDGETIPIAPLQSVLGLPGRAGVAAEETAVIIETRGARVAIIADGVLEEQELVFQELRGPLQQQVTMAGAAILGNGDIVPILDIQGLSGRVALPPVVGAAAAPAPAAAAATSGRVLVVEDSLVAGDLLKGILIGAGYDAAIAHDGIEALEVCSARPCDLVISDVDAQHGRFVLTEQMRADPLRTIP